MTNTAFRAARLDLDLSQDELAAALRRAGMTTCSKRLVQRWEAGAVKHPQGASVRALQQVFQARLVDLGFEEHKGRQEEPGDGLGRREVLTLGALVAMPVPEGKVAEAGKFEGIWLSRYEYYSSSRDEWHHCSHYCVIAHRGGRLRLRSLPQTAPGVISMELSVRDANVVTGTWEERTDPNGYYRGSVYYGAIQMTGDPSGRRLTGKWLGFGAESEVNDGPWTLTRVTRDTRKASLQSYNRPAADKTSDGDDAE